MFTIASRRAWATRAGGVLAIATVTLLVTAGAAVSLPGESPGGLLKTVERAAATALAETGLAPAETPAPNAPVQAGGELKGMFRIDAGSCEGAVSGSHFRMVDPGGGMVQNADSPCSDQTHTPLSPGRDGGLSTVDYQPHPTPAFEGFGHGANDRITTPQAFFGTRFSTATNPTDPQTNAGVPVPSVVHDGSGNLSGNLSAFAAGWNAQHFNQGAPKPDGSTPGRTSAPAGTYDPATGRYSISWSSTIVGGPFNNFTGQWHFEGTFQPAVTEAPPAEPAPDPGPGGGILPLPLPPPLGAGTAGSLTAAPAAPVTAAAPDRVAGQVAAGELKGLFRVTPGECATSGQESGSYFRMIQAGGNADTGPFIANTGTKCADRTFTDLSPGRDGGLSTTAFQPNPDPVFDTAGNGLNDKITMPQEFFGTKFSTATNETDPQTNTSTTLPVIRVDAAGNLSGDLRAFAAAWQSQHFNQGAPKPDGTTPGLTRGPTGTIDPATKQFTIEWVTTIKSDSGASPFENFTGLWHFEGTFEGALPGAAAPPASGGDVAATGDPSAQTVGASQAGAPGVPTPRTGPSFPAGFGAGFLGLALIGRWAVSRSRPPQG